jgi:lipopolysaccharide heptosyltransferase II
MKYLIIRLSSLGDVVLATPTARAIKKKHPEATVHFLTEKHYAPLLEGNPNIDEVIPYDKRGTDGGVGGILRLVTQLREERYDIVVDLQHKVRSIILSSLSGAYGRLVMRKRTLGQGLAEITGMSGPAQSLHTVDMYMNVLSKVDIPPDGRRPELYLDTQAGHKVRDGFEKARKDFGKVVGFNVGAGNATKKLPISTIREAAVSLQQHGYGIALVGARMDSGAIYNISSGLERSPVINAQHFSVKELAAAISELDVLVSADSGPVHIASALGTPTVAVYGPTSPLRWGPLGEKNEVIWHELPCAPCSNHGGANCPMSLGVECMRSIKSSELVDAVKRLLPE